MKHWFIIISFLVLYSTTTHAQSNHFLDSIQVIKDDSSRIHTLLNRVNEIKYADPKQGIIYASHAAVEAKAIKNIPLETRAYILKGVCMEKMSRIDSSIYYLELALKLSQTHNNIKGIASANNNLGLSYHARMQYEKALTHFIASESAFLALKDDKNIAKLYTNIGMVKSKLNDDKSAMEYYNKALALAKKHDDHFGIGSIYNNISETYYSKGQIQKAKEYLELSRKEHELSGDKFGLSNVLLNLGNVSYDLKLYKPSISYLRASIALKQELEDKIGLAKSYLFLGKNQKALGDNTLSKSYLDTARYYTTHEDMPEEKMEIYSALSAHYEAVQHFDSSLYYYKLYANLYAKSYNDSNSYRVNELNAKYETAKKENKILLQEKDLKLKNNLIIYSGITLGLLAILGISGYKRRELKKKNKLNETLLDLQLEHTKELFAAEEKERQKIANELHDSTGQILTVARMKAEIYEDRNKPMNIKQSQDMDKIKELIDRACVEIRSFSHQLKSMELERFGLYGAIKKLLQELHSDKLSTTFTSEGNNPTLGNQEEIILYRTIQEATKNIITHAKASQLNIDAVVKDKSLNIKIQDNGVGFDTDKAKLGLGIQNMKNRIAFIRGEMDITSTPNQGTTITITIPQ